MSWTLVQEDIASSWIHDHFS